MDVTQARTFLAVLETGSFLHAADRVNVAQSTVSTRIKALEDALGQELFIRNRAGATPTQVGREFARHAAAIVRLWDQARLTLALPADHKKRLIIGGQPSLWDGFLLKWLPWMQNHAPEIAVSAQMLASSPALMQQLLDGLIDFAVLYRPTARPGIVIEQIFEEHLVLVSSDLRPAQDLTSLQAGRYVFVDWGPEFAADHALNFPGMATPPLTLNVGTLGISFLLENQASGYFPLRVAAPFVQSGALTLVKDAPVFTYPVYGAYPEEHDSQVITPVLNGLRHVSEHILPRI